MQWFDFWTGSGEYGGGTSWETDIGAAYDQAVTWVEQAADGRGWSDAERTAALDEVESAYTYATWTSLFGNPVETFWSKLAEYWEDQDAAVPPGWDKLGAAFASAGDASYDPIERATANVKETAGDILSDAKDKIDPEKSWWPWAAGAVLVLYAINTLRAR